VVDSSQEEVGGNKIALLVALVEGVVEYTSNPTAAGLASAVGGKAA
jgi:hypothetical protein